MSCVETVKASTLIYRISDYSSEFLKTVDLVALSAKFLSLSGIKPM